MEWNMEENFSMEWNMEENFSLEWNMEWKIFGMEWKKIASMEYGKIIFHSIGLPFYPRKTCNVTKRCILSSKKHQKSQRFRTLLGSSQRPSPPDPPAGFKVVLPYFCV